MKSIAIITLQYPHNYGSALQAFALQTAVENLGVSAEIIDYLMPYDFENYKLFRFHQYKNRPKSPENNFNALSCSSLILRNVIICPYCFVSL